ncbi:MAG: LCP family protein [Erysipelotrichaceae bacterium]|nr:LCP family protein [Erysipelotrichaceae bacterium]
MTNIIRKITDWKVIFALQTIASAVLVALLFNLGILPMKYAIIAIVVLAIIDILMLLLMKPSKNGKGKIRNIVGKVISVLLSIILMIGSLYVAQGNSALDTIAGTTTQTNRMVVVVLDESDYASLSDISGEIIEINNEDDSDNLETAIAALNEEDSSISTYNVGDYETLCNDLYDSSTPAILINEANYAFMENYQENFDSETRVIWSYDIDSEVEDISKNVDVTNTTFTMFISGIDTTGKVSTVSRSDVNMLVTVNPETKQILMTSIPRDYYVTLANKNAKDKLTHAGLAGVDNSVKTIENFMGIDINYYARVNFTSLVTIVDALGGVSVYSDYNFTSMHGNYTFTKGYNDVDGDMALGFVRERYSLPNGDNDRIRNQQYLLTAMLKKAMSPAIITNYSSLLNAISGSFETNMTSDEITSLIKMQLNDMADWDIQQIQLTGTGTSMTGGAYMPNNKLYYMIPDEDSVENAASLIQAMVDGETISVE